MYSFDSSRARRERPERAASRPARTQSQLGSMAAAEAELAALPADEYLERFHLQPYLKDALALVLVHRPEQPLKFLAEYYRRVRNGENVRNREFKYINATPRNRLAYLDLFRHTYASLADRADLTFLDYLELQRLLCPDFSSQFCEDVAKCLTTTGSLSNTLAFQPFLSMFQLLFYYSEFMMQAGEVYRKCMTTAAVANGGSSGKHGVVRSIAFLEAVRAYIYGSLVEDGRSNHPKPSFDVVEAVLQEFTDAAQKTPPPPTQEQELQGGDKGDNDREQSGSSEFHSVPVVGGVPITFNDVCASLARRKEVTAVFSDDWHVGPAMHGIPNDYTTAGWAGSGRWRRESGAGSARAKGGHGGLTSVGRGFAMGVDGDHRPASTLGGFGRGGALPEGFGRPSTGDGQAASRLYRGLRQEEGGKDQVDPSAAPGGKKKTTGKKKKVKKVKKATPTG